MDDLCQAPTPIYEKSLNENKTESGYFGKPLITEENKQENISATNKKFNKKKFIIVMSIILIIILILISFFLIRYFLGKGKEEIECYTTIGNQTYMNYNICGYNITEDITPLYQFYLKTKKMKNVSYQLYINYKWSSWVKEPKIVGEMNVKNFGVSFILPENWQFRAYMAIAWTPWMKSRERIQFGASNTHITNIEFRYVKFSKYKFIKNSIFISFIILIFLI